MSKKSFSLYSDDLGGSFSKNQVMDKFGCSGGNTSPHLRWENAPEGTKSFALTLHDPDAPTDSGFWHWAVFNLPANTNELPAGAGDPASNLLPGSAFMGQADTGNKAYDGPCPPEGDFRHRYILTVYALNTDTPEIDADTPLAQAIFKISMMYELERASLIAYFKK
ncbi:MAG: YbhB/YbcL family Raf kinase inhibitor-like protein [Owenweeksia sp.]|nr:YbhB/YbcL family Raf kinase inhibitor-like protein [Owenweeksia sp.]